MPITMSLWTVNDGVLGAVPEGRIDLENQLENWLHRDPSLLNLDVLVLGRQIRTEFGGYIDILAMNREGDLVVIELKRERTPREVVAQCLDYASWVAGLGYETLAEIYQHHSSSGLAEAFEAHFDEPLPEAVNEDHQIVVVASALDDSTERIIRYLTDRYSANINAVLFNVFQLNGQTIIGRSFFQNPEAMEEKTRRGKKPPWTGFLFVNTGITPDNSRDWSLNVQCEFISAGGGSRWINAIKKLQPGDKIFAYVKNAGYVGYGTVKEAAVPVTEYQHGGFPLNDQLPSDHPWRDQSPTEESGEWLARVQWLRTFDVEHAKWLDNGFANQNVVCKLRDPRTFEFLKREFDVKE